MSAPAIVAPGIGQVIRERSAFSTATHRASVAAFKHEGRDYWGDVYRYRDAGGAMAYESALWTRDKIGRAIRVPADRIPEMRRAIHLAFAGAVRRYAQSL